MSSSVLSTRECCAWCRRPITTCTAPACDSTPTYSGILVRGQWIEVAAPQDAPAGRPLRSRRPLRRSERRTWDTRSVEPSALP